MKPPARWLGAALALLTAVSAAAQDAGEEGRLKGRLIAPRPEPKSRGNDFSDPTSFVPKAKLETYNLWPLSLSHNYENQFRWGGLEQDTGPNAAASLVVVFYFESRKGEKLFCTGTLVSPTKVLTAGHCGCGKVATYEVYLGEFGRSGNQQPIRLERPPIFFDARICRGGAPFGSDLALLKLAQGVWCPDPPAPKRSDEEGILCAYCEPQRGSGCRLATADDAFSARPYMILSNTDAEDRVLGLRRRLQQKNAKVRAMGFGYTETGAHGSRMGGGIPVFSAACEEPALRSICGPFLEMVLVDKKRDTCGGDSGGPVFLDYDDNEKRKLIAVTSRALPVPGNDNAHHCGGGGIYTLLGRNPIMGWLAAQGLPYSPEKDQARQ